MNVLEKINFFANSKKDSIAIFNDNCEDKELTYKELDDFSDKLAYYLESSLKSNKNPIVVYGHKNPYMIVCFLACVKSGRAYCPVDISVPDERVRDIIEETQSPVILSTENLNFEAKNVIDLEEIKNIIKNSEGKIQKSSHVKPDETFYIIFTSGSTGKPKGVQITLDCLDNFLKWSSRFGGENLENSKNVFINQAPFSFDLSVMDLYTSLFTGSKLWCLNKSVQTNYESLLDSLKKSNASVWVSTPSFANMCLASYEFNKNLLKNIKLFLFCGEALSNLTAKKLVERFPESKIINTYGPTESTVAITEIMVNEEVLEKYNPLPIGKPKNGTFVFIIDSEGNILPEGEKGEILIVGDSVSIGYFNRPDVNKKSFGLKEVNGKTYRSYKTGDEGYIKDGNLFYCGRIDLQVKLHGYRIELEDIESNLLKLSKIKNTVVLPILKNGTVENIAAFIVPNFEIDSKLKAQSEIKKDLSKFLPSYMIPKKIIFKDILPMTNNGKVNRKKLMEEL